MSLLCVGTATLFSACSSNKGGGVSAKTGWDYNDPKLGGFDVPNYRGQQTGPGLVFIEGGRFTMGQTEEQLGEDQNNIPRTVSVSSFYMDETEVANVHYREYTYWMARAYSSDYPDLVAKTLPDSSVWRKALSYNEPMVNLYFRHAGYNFYPVVGVNWNQANEYCKWRTDRVNEYILIKSGKLKKNPNQVNEDVYTDDTYLSGQYEGIAGGNRKKDFDPNGSGKRSVNYSDGIFLPDYRLPTEAEWEFAALGLIGNNPDPATKRRRGEEVITNRNTYPWGDPHTTRYGIRNSYQGEFLANYKRGAGDAMGVPGGLNDNADYPAPVTSYQANAVGLYNMAGNVSEWVADTYRPGSHQDVEDFNPFRGNELYTYRRNPEDGSLEEKDSIGHLPTRQLDTNEIKGQSNYTIKSPDLRSYSDGDSLSGYTYDYGNTTLYNDDTKVIKGGSWADRAYWMSPGTRRYMQASAASSTVGFRCAMSRIGSPNGKNTDKAGQYFSGKRKRK
jgi:gliding motility-associated lipoprotein GldJ